MVVAGRVKLCFGKECFELWLGVFVQLPIPGQSSFALALLSINHEVTTYQM